MSRWISLATFQQLLKHSLMLGLNMQIRSSSCASEQIASQEECTARDPILRNVYLETRNSFGVMTCFLTRCHNILPHRSLQRSC